MSTLVARRMIPHVSSQTGCYLAQSNRIYKYCYKTKSLQYIDMVTKESSLIKIFIKEVIFRNWFFRNFISNTFGIGHISISNDQHLIAIYDCLYYRDLSNPKKGMVRIGEYSQLKISNPLFGGIAAVPNKNHFYFGEYINTRSEIRILKFDCTTKALRVVHTFSEGEIKHIHGIFYDKYRNRLWVTTGDSDVESKIFFTDDEFSTLEVLGGGDQTWRAVSVVPLKDAVLWGTDAGKDARATDINKVYNYVFETQTRHELVKVGNPVYHASMTSDGRIILGINFEPGRKQDTDEASSIWHSSEADLNNWQVLSSHPYKNSGVTNCSKYGYVYLPKGEQLDDCIIYSVLNADNRGFAAYSIKLSCAVVSNA